MQLYIKTTFHIHTRAGRLLMFDLFKNIKVAQLKA